MHIMCFDILSQTIYSDIIDIPCHLVEKLSAKPHEFVRCREKQVDIGRDL